MLSPGEIKKEIEERLKAYLSRDKSGIRKELLTLFIRIRSLTISEIHARLNERFSISIKAVASMVGIIASRIGILHVRRNAEGTNSVYEVKEQYLDVMTRIVAAS
ncbi:MAG: DUF2551 domain-containing protein [Methanocalculus sp. MSAO_Arc1]|uniref:DUF2551 domain-containing protein n=1 Tax=Methanocalculus TaxID=71151 RepID=UPI000FF4BC4F|nr:MULTISPECIES: DUF2551 domain-containing protein [unclassified Methanocalculus]MCP1661729.1 hypothetical protein [Methanocalculus sp. AMF5]RQD79398.1 MAG: DUF2551 domain-containing protein [Methanocalculus sp. MSAO_Arc1]